jgi:hypothetical protein
MMTHKERMLKAARGEWPDQLPWVPRIDLWHNANSLRETLPSRYRRDATLDEIADDLGGGWHKLVPEFLKLRTPDDDVDRGLGIFRLRGMPYRAELTGVEREVKREGDTTQVTYHTAAGSVSYASIYTEEMRRNGVSITWITEHVIKMPKDYKVVGHIFRNIRIHPDYDNYLEFQRRVGDKGFAPAFGNSGAGPMQHIMRDFLDATKFYMEMYDHPRELKALCEDMEPFFDQMFKVLADCPAEVVFFGANYDEMITYPPFFKEHILPYLQKFADLLHSQGKLLICHCDGENQGLLDLMAESGMDIAEAICPQPMTKVKVTDVKKAFKGKITIFGGIPSVVLLENSMSDEEFERYMKRLFQEIAPGDRFILGVSDTTPPDAKFERLFRITDMVNEWGRLPMRT